MQHQWFVPAAVLLMAASLIWKASAQEPPARPASDPLAGHSYHGEAFNEGPRQGAYLMGGTGDVHFPITTSVPLAQRFFDQGVGQLHGFWHFEAERSFRQAAALDPQCAMAYWGMAMANVENEKRAKGLIEKAVERKGSAGPREVLWIEALAAFHAAKNDKERRRAYVRSLEEIIHAYPDDIEAKAFLAVALWRGQSQWPISSHTAVGALLDQVFAVSPLHPAHHYAIHLWDGEKPERALKHAAASGPSAPAIAHQWHMAGHIYSKLHRFTDSAWQQEASARVDHAQMIRDRILPDQIHNYAHNNEWLVRNLGHIGRVRDAIDLAKNMIELPRHPRYNLLERGSSKLGRARLFEVLELYELWDELVALGETFYLEPTAIKREKVRRLRSLGVALFARGELERGREALAALDAILQETRASRQAAAEAAEEKARAASKPDDEVLKAMSDALRPFFERLRPIENALAELRALEALAKGERAAASGLLEKLRELPKARLALLQLEAGEEDKAEELAREAVRQGENEVVPLAVYIHVLERRGKREEAAARFEELRSLSGAIDIEAPPFRRLEPLARELGLPADWRLAAPASTGVGERPDLEALGSFRWHPPPAPEWSLRDGRGETLSLSDYRGKPLVMIFYLGAGCIHCVEQLETFAPRAPEFADAGIALAAVSTEAADALALFPAGDEAAPLPFPLLADPRLETFKAYRAFDDFENMPLHGTFLIDGAGRLLWQDISFEPFSDAGFLLAEAVRLLALHGGAPGAHPPEIAAGKGLKAAAAEAEDYPIPEGSPAELLGFIEKLRRDAAGTPAPASRKARERTIARAAERAFAAGKDEAMRAAATKARLEALASLVSAGERTALAEIDRSLAEARGEERPRLVEEVASQLIEGFKSTLSRSPQPRVAEAAQQAARWIESCGNPELAAEAYRELGALLARSETPSLVLQGRKLEGDARRLELAGEPAELGGVLADGKPLDGSLYSGKPLAVAFWASWNGGSAAALRPLEVLRKAHGGALEVLGVSLDRNRSSLEAFLQAHEISWPTLFSEDPQASGWNHPMAVHYGIRELPAVLLVGRDGRIVSLEAGGKELEEAIGRLLEGESRRY
jgi:peroxiredoxin